MLQLLAKRIPCGSTHWFADDDCIRVMSSLICQLIQLHVNDCWFIGEATIFLSIFACPEIDVTQNVITFDALMLVR